MIDQPDPMTLRVRQMVADIVEEFGSVSHDKTYEGDVAMRVIEDTELMSGVERIMNKCGLRFVAYIVEE